MILALFFLLLLFSPTQLGKHWWPSWSLVSGVRVDYLSPILFFTDIIFVFLICLALWEYRKSVRNSLKRVFSFSYLFFIFYFLFFIFHSPRPLLSLYWIIRYAQIPLVAWVTHRLILRNSSIAMSNRIGLGLSLAVIWTVLLSIVQVVTGHTTGWFWLLGERSFTVTTPGISTVSVTNHVMLRPYATFPHPNALAGFLAVCFFVLKHLGMKRGLLLLRIARTFAVVGVLSTFSRLAIVSLVAALIAFNAPAFASLITFPSQSVPERLMLANAAFQMIRGRPLFGVGPGHFLVELPRYLPRGTWMLQPVHNVLLLMLAEFGIVGTTFLGYVCWRLMRTKPRVSRPLLAACLVITLTSLGDHYWITSQQNRLLLGVVLGLLTRFSSAQQQGVGFFPRPLRTS